MIVISEKKKRRIENDDCYVIFWRNASRRHNIIDELFFIGLASVFDGRLEIDSQLIITDLSECIEKQVRIIGTICRSRQ